MNVVILYESMISSRGETTRTLNGNHKWLASEVSPRAPGAYKTNQLRDRQPTQTTS